MIESALLRWVLTVVFGGTAVWFLLCTARRGVAVPERISSMGHVVMSSLTVPMAWTWGMQIPTPPQIAVLSLAAVWFFVLAIGDSRSGSDRDHEGLSGRIHHVMMMVAMVWMLATMPHLMAATSHGPGFGGHHAPSSGTSGSVAKNPTTELPIWITIVTVALAGYLVLSSMRWIAAAVDRGRDAATTSTPVSSDALPVLALTSACYGVMSIGMAAMLLAALPF